jgi:hypothetical protein
MISTPILNPVLYNALRARFGAVKVASPGERYEMHAMRDPENPYKVIEECVHAGEYYCVCCPYCKDERFRLWVNHMWNTRGPDGRIVGRNLIICYNEGCDMFGFHKQLHFFSKDVPRIGAKHIQGLEEELFKPVTLPGKCTPINTLSTWHPAVRYLTNGRLTPLQQAVVHQPEALWNDWRVCYCEKAEHNKGYATEFVENRLIFPIYRRGVMVGWQARAIDNTTPKYYTRPRTPKRHLLVNGDRAKMFPIGVVVEGFFDAFAVGHCAVAALGKHLSYWQLKELRNFYADGMVCLLLDPDAAEDMRVTLDSLQTAFKYGCFGVTLPAGWDAGACTQAQIWAKIREEGQRQGFKVP